MPSVHEHHTSSEQATSPSASGSVRLSPMKGCGLVVTFALGLIAFGFLDVVRPNSSFQWSFFGTGALLLVWSMALFGLSQRKSRTLTLKVAFRKQHYVQASAQAVFLLYWGWHWRPVYDSAFLVAAQLIFAYAFDMLLCWSRRDSYTFGFGPFPVIFSIITQFLPDFFPRFVSIPIFPIIKKINANVEVVSLVFCQYWIGEVK